VKAFFAAIVCALTLAPSSNAWLATGDGGVIRARAGQQCLFEGSVAIDIDTGLLLVCTKTYDGSKRWVIIPSGTTPCCYCNPLCIRPQP